MLWRLVRIRLTAPSDGDKGAKLKVQVAIQGDELRVSDKKRDNLQDAIALIKELKITQPLQYVNFRD